MNELFIPIDSLPGTMMVWIPIILSILVYIIFRKSIPKEFKQFPTWKIILFVVIFLLGLLNRIININTKTFFSIPKYTISVIGLWILSLIIYFTFISAIHALICAVKDKKRKNRQKEINTSIWFVALFNPITMIIIISILIIASGYVENYGKTVCGVEIKDVTSGSPAAMIGIQYPDHVISIDYQTVNTPEDFIRIMSSTKPGQNILLQTNSQAYDVILTNSPDNPSIGYLGVKIGPKLCQN